MVSERNKIICIIGPTASGKSSLAIHLARRQGGRILSVDSMQVYEQMDIGTAKPTLAERHEIPHHMIDWCRPDESFSVARFVELADDVIARSGQTPGLLLATGGTPLYFKALFYGLFDGPGADEAVRARLSEFSDDELHEKVAQTDPAASQRIHRQDRRRLIRALEVAELTGKPISSFQTDWESGAEARHRALWIGLLWEKEAINRRINMRVRDMIDAGWLDEVRDLAKRFPNLSPTASQATGYGELIGHLQGQMTLPDAIEQIKIRTRQLARKQMKWFKRFPGVKWIAGDMPVEQQAEEVLRLLAHAGASYDPLA